MRLIFGLLSGSVLPTNYSTVSLCVDPTLFLFVVFYLGRPRCRLHIRLERISCRFRATMGIPPFSFFLPYCRSPVNAASLKALYLTIPLSFCVIVPCSLSFSCHFLRIYNSLSFALIFPFWKNFKGRKGWVRPVSLVQLDLWSTLFPALSFLSLCDRMLHSSSCHSVLVT